MAATRNAVSAPTLTNMVGPKHGKAGVIVPPEYFISQLHTVTDETGMLLILDEKQTGVGRTGAMFAFQHHASEPDIVTLGKRLGSGVPVSATLAKQSLCCFQHGDQAGTCSGNPLMTAVALSLVNTVAEPELLPRVPAAEKHLSR